MPTYRYQCKKCAGEFEVWQSIHDDALTVHGAQLDPLSNAECNGSIVRVITGVRTYGVGKRGERTLEADAMDKKLDEDRPAYKRLRAEGHQPRAVMGSGKLEALAKNDWEIKTGGMVSVPDERKSEIDEMLAAGAQGTWDPVEEVHARRKEKTSA